jgi:hypothetical protein
MTFGKFNALLERRAVQWDHELYCASLIATTVYNMSIKSKKTKPLKTDHFVPKRKKRQSPDAQKKVAENIARLLGGRVIGSD